MIRHIASLILLGLLPISALAQPQRVAVAKTTSPAAAFAARSPTATKFEVLPANAELHTSDVILALPGATLESKTGAVAVTSLADYDKRSPLPILETALILNPPEKDIDLAFQLDRGRVDITNKKARGSAVVKVVHREKKWTIKLEDPGARVAIEVCGRWPAGSRFKLVNPKRSEKLAEPVASLVLLVLKGSAQVEIGGTAFGMSAPPGPSILEWDSLAGAPQQPKKLTALPDWADPTANLTPDAKKLVAAIEKFRALRAEKPADAIKQFLDSSDPVEQRVAIVTLGATDDLVSLGKALIEAKSLEEWDFGITVLRHWIGRAPGQDQRFYQHLTTARGYTPTEAKIIMQLLFGFSAEELKSPETYEVLIDYLAHEKPGIRNLAVWHLIRLVPQGKTIPYKPNGTLTDAVKAQEAWKKLVPTGELPPPPKK
ncbi:MAG: hypothetical protein L0241_27125 [Planctomycetia bacterium]|nr:hypothetical protein [Planctomycetia bacterium]